MAGVSRTEITVCFYCLAATVWARLVEARPDSTFTMVETAERCPDCQHRMRTIRRVYKQAS